MTKSALGYLRRQYLCVLRRCAWLNAVANISVMSGAAMALAAPSVQAQTIVPDGRTQTQLRVNGLVTDITTQTVRGPNAFNSFSRFDVDQAATVNLHLPGGTANLLNLVTDHRSYINGLVNAYKDSAIGGNVFFFNPHGIVVGSGGVLNVGSLTLTTPTAKFMDRLVSPGGDIDIAATSEALAGHVPLSPTGLVLVKGRINAADAVTLAGGNVNVEAGAQIFAGGKAQVAFADLVNVDRLQTAADVKVDGGLIRIVAAEDITVAGQVSADGVGEQANGGSVTVMADGNSTLEASGKVSADAGSSGDGGFVEYSAHKTVYLNGNGLSARAAGGGEAGNILIDPTDLSWSGSSDYTWAGSTYDQFSHGANLTITASNKVSLDNVMLSTRDIGNAPDTRANHLTGTSQGKSGNIAIAAKDIELKNGTQLLAQADNGQAAGKITITATDNQSTPAFGSLEDSIAKISIKNSVIKGSDVSIKATANDKWVWTGNEYADVVLDFLGNLRLGANLTVSTAHATVDVDNGASIDATGTLDIEAHSIADASMKVMSSVVGFGYGETDSQAKITIGNASLGSGGAMSLKSQADSTLSVNVDTVNTGAWNNAASSASKYANLSFAVGIGKQVAQTTVGSAATITRASSLDVEASGKKDHSVASSGGSFKDGIASSGISVLISNTTLTASLGGNVTADQVSVKSTLAEAETEVSAAAGTGGSPDLQEAITSAKPVDEILFEKLSDFVAKAPDMDQRSGASSKLGLSAAFAWVENDNNVKAEVTSGAHVTSHGRLDVMAKAEESLAFETSAAVDQRDLDSQKEGDTTKPEDKKKVAISASVAVIDVNHHAEALIGDGAVIKADGAISVISQSIITPFYQQWVDLIDDFKTMDWTSATAWMTLGKNLYDLAGDPIGATSWTQTAVESEKLAFAGAVDFFKVDQKATAKIGDADINVGMTPTSAQDVTVSAYARQGVLNLVGVPEFDPTAAPGTNSNSGAAGFGGSYHQYTLTGGTDATIARGATVLADDVAVAAETDFDQIILSETVGKAGKVSINGAFSLADIDTDTIAQIASGVSLGANDVLVKASDDSMLINAAGGVARSQSVGIGFSVAINDVDRDTLAIVGNRDTETGSGGSLSTSGNLLLDAHATGFQGAFAVAGAGPAAKEDDAAKGGDGSKTNAKDTGQQGKSGVGISAAATVNLVNDTTTASISDLASVTVSGTGDSSVGVDKDGDGTADSIIALAKGLIARAKNEALAIAGAGALTVAVDKSAGLSGAFTWNQLVKDTRATIADATVTVHNGGVKLDAENSKAMWSISASGAGGGKVGIAGSVAYSTIDNVTEAAIDNANVDADSTVVLDAKDNSDIRSVAGSASYGGKAGVGAAVAISTVHSDTTARISGAGKTVNGDAGVGATATNDNSIVAVAAAVGASQGVAASGAVTWNVITNQTEATLSGANVTSSGNAVNLDADDTADIFAISGNAAISTGQGSVGISGSYNEINNKTYARATGGSLSGTSVRLEATEDATIKAIAAGGSGSSKVAVSGSLGVNTIGNITEASTSGTTVNTAGDATVRAADNSDIFSVTGAVGVAGNGAVGASGSYNHIGSTVTAQITGGVADAANVLVDAERTARMEVWAVAGSGAGTAGFAGSIALNDIGGVTTASISGAADVEASGNALVTAESDDRIDARAGAIGIGGSVGGAGSIAFNNVHADTLAQVTGANTQVTGLGNGGLAQVDNGNLSSYSGLPSDHPLSDRQQKDNIRGAAVVASSKAQVENFTISAAGGGSTGVAGTVSVAMMTGYTSAEVTDNAKLNTSFGNTEQEARVAAYHHDNLWSVSGGGAIGGDVGAGGAMDTLIGSHITTAQVRGAIVQGRKAVTVDAGSTLEISQMVIGLGGGTYAGLSGSIGLVLVDGKTQALVWDGDLNSKGDLTVEATSTTDADIYAGAVSLSGVAGIGLTGTVSVYDQTTQAIVGDDSKLNANKTTRIKADNDTEQDVISGTASAAGGVGIAGTVNVAVIKGTTQAVFGAKSDAGKAASQINVDAGYGGSEQDVVIEAADTTHIDNYLGGLGIGLGGAGVGAAVDVVMVNNGASAEVRSGTIRTDRDITVQADTERMLDSFTIAAAGGSTVGISGAVSVLTAGSRPDSDADSEVGTSVGEIARHVSASAFGNQMDSDAGGTSASRDAANAARAKADVDDDMNAPTAAASARAYVATGTTLDAGRDVAITANNGTDADAIAVGVAVSGGFSLGGGVALAFVDDKTEAEASGVIKAGRNVTVQADDGPVSDTQGLQLNVGDIHINQRTAASKLIAFAGGGGVVGLGASVAIQNKTSMATAKVGNNADITAHGTMAADAGGASGLITIDAGIQHDLESTAFGAAVGLGGIGAAIAHTTLDGDADALVGNGALLTGKALDVHGHSKTDSAVSATAAAGGLFSGAGADADAEDTSSAKARIGDNVVVRTQAGLAQVRADVDPVAKAQSLGVAVSASISIGVSLADATVETRAEASTGSGLDVEAGAMTVQAETRLRGKTAETAATAGAGGALLGAGASEANSIVHTETVAEVGVGNMIFVTGEFKVYANSDTYADADVTGINVGLLAAGGNTAKAKTYTETYASMGDNLTVTAGAVNVKADGNDKLRASTMAGAGGLGVLLASKAETEADSKTRARLGEEASNGVTVVGGTVVADTVVIDALQHINFDATADSTSAAAVGASGARAINDIDSQTLAAIGQNMTVSAKNLFSARAGNHIDKSTAGASGYQVDSGSGGVLNAAAARSESDIRNDAQVSLGQDALIGVNNPALNLVRDNNGRWVNVPVNGLLEMAAWNDVAVYDRVRLDSGGAIAIARAESIINNVSTAGVSVGQDAGLLSDGNIELSARTAAAVQTRAHSKTYGLAGAAEGKAHATITANQAVQIDSGAFIEAQESVHLMAGADRTQTNQLDADAETRLWNRTAVPIETDPEALGQVVQHNDVTVASGAQVRAVRDVYLTASEGVHKARGYGEGTDLYREALSAIGEFFGADTSSLKITGGSSYDNANLNVPAGGPSSRVDVEGTVQAGIWSHQWITVDANGNITSSEALEGITEKSDHQNVALLLQQEIDKIEDAAAIKQAQYDNFKGGSAAAAAIEAQASASAQYNAAQHDLDEANLVKINVQGYVDTARNSGSSATAAAAAAANAANLAASQAATNTGDTGTTAAVRVAAAATAAATAAGAANAATANTAANLAETVSSNLTQAANDTSDPAAKAYLQTMASAASAAASTARAVATAATAEAAVRANSASTPQDIAAATQATANAVAAADAAVKSAAVLASNDAETTANQAVSQATSWLGTANTQLAKANDDLAAAQNANGSSDAALGMYADAQFLSTQLAQLQGATNVDFVDIGVAGDIITARSGNVRVSGKALTGSGGLSAPGDAKIEIKNQSTRFMRVNADLLIPDEGGGQVTFNGMRVSSSNDINQRNAIGQSANLGITDALNTDKPLILVENSNSLDSGNSGGPAQLWIYGNITNLGGEAKATSHGTLRVAGNISAETVNLATGGDFIKTWTPGYTHQGGDPVARLGNLPNQREVAKANYAQTGLPDCDAVECGSTIAGNNVYISAEKLNINGLIQAGLPERGIDINNALLAKPNADNAALTNTLAINAARAAWTASPTTAARYINLTNPTADGIADSGDIKLRYDAQFDRLELADVRMGGGHMELFGDIFSTGNGELRVMDGYGRINITNTTGYDLAVGRLDTGPGVQGMIRITDTARDLSGNYRGAGNTPLVTEITRENGVATMRTNTGAGGAMQVVPTPSANDGRSTSFNPMTNRRFNWINGQTTNWERIESYETKTTWGADWFGRDPGQQPNFTPPPTQTYLPRVSGDWLSIVAKQGADYELDYSNATSAEVKTNLPTTSRKADCFWGVCHSRIYTSSEKYSWSQYENYHHSLNASQSVNVKFTGFDSSQVRVDSDGQLLFSGLVRSLAGDITANAAGGMAVLNPDARLLGKEINLNSSTGAIGSASAPVRLELVNGGAVTASGRDGVALATSRGDLLINSVMAAQGDVNLTADGHIRSTGAGTSVTGKNVSLVSLNGGIHGWMDNLALRVETLGDDGSLSARAVGDIRLQEATGDMRLQQVASVTGDVHLDSPGRLLDANAVEQVDEKTRDELLALWKEMGLRGDEAEDALDHSLEKQAARLKQEYEAYFRLRNLHRLDDGSYTAAAYDPGYTFHTTAVQALVLKSVNNWTDADVARYESDQTAAYHAAQARFGVGGYVVNFAPTLTAAEIAALSEGSSWTDAQLANGLASGLFRPVSDTDIRVEDANVIGHQVTLDAQTGIGLQRATPAVIKLDANGLLSDDDKLILLTAERKDITNDGHGQISVRQYEDLDVTVSGTLNADTASGSALLGSEADITLGQIRATDEVRVKTGANLLGQAGQTNVVAASAVLEAGQGSLGSAVTPISVDLAVGGTLTARAGADLFVREVNGDMVVSSVFARGDVSLDAQGSLVEAVEDSLLDVRGTSVALSAGNTVGQPGGQKALDVQVGKTGLLSASAPNGVYLNSTGLSGRLGNITTQGVFQLAVADGGITLVGSVRADAGVSLTAADDIQFDGGKVRSGAGVVLDGGTDGSGSVKGDGNGVADVEADGSVTVVATDDIGGVNPLQLEVAELLTLRATNIHAEVSARPANNALAVSATGAIGDTAHNVNLRFSSSGPVVFPTLILHNGMIRSSGPDLSVALGYLGDAVTFVTPNFAARIDHIVRSMTPGLDVRAFTLDNDFSLTMNAGSVRLSDFIVNQNLLRNIIGTPSGVADVLSHQSLQTVQRQLFHEGGMVQPLSLPKAAPPLVEMEQLSIADWPDNTQTKAPQ